eukprot:CAMPEP_0115262458 /NCGR_PEP_ID=MMETSP0270-20121206/49394_1 /TAXON_ID=71861 /ORGANISM="Scrippsiella trochoidea, Strain CCMP3099" /LENGTH=135 /DNA_ID=CAMNT_0002678387 /DNA_START=219 /DNA_END=626 /DNA_ORIENTATION=+
MTTAIAPGDASCNPCCSAMLGRTEGFAMDPLQLPSDASIQNCPCPLSTAGFAKTDHRACEMSSSSFTLLVHELPTAAGFTSSSHRSMSRQGCKTSSPPTTSDNAVAEAGVRLDTFACSSQRARASAEESSHRRPS